MEKSSYLFLWIAPKYKIEKEDWRNEKMRKLFLHHMVSFPATKSLPLK